MTVLYFNKFFISSWWNEEGSALFNLTMINHRGDATHLTLANILPLRSKIIDHFVAGNQIPDIMFYHDIKKQYLLKEIN